MSIYQPSAPTTLPSGAARFSPIARQGASPVRQPSGTGISGAGYPVPAAPKGRWADSGYWRRHRDFYVMDERVKLTERPRTTTVLSVKKTPGAPPPEWDKHSNILEHHIADTNHYSYPTRPHTSDATPRITKCPSPRVQRGSSSCSRRIPAVEGLMGGVEEKYTRLMQEHATSNLELLPQFASRPRMSDRSPWLLKGNEPENYVAGQSLVPPGGAPGGRITGHTWAEKSSLGVSKLTDERDGNMTPQPPWTAGLPLPARSVNKPLTTAAATLKLICDAKPQATTTGRGRKMVKPNMTARYSRCSPCEQLVLMSRRGLAGPMRGGVGRIGAVGLGQTRSNSGSIGTFSVFS